MDSSVVRMHGRGKQCTQYHPLHVLANALDQNEGERQKSYVVEETKKERTNELHDVLYAYYAPPFVRPLPPRHGVASARCETWPSSSKGRTILKSNRKNNS